jgi:hypothetical protein
MRPADDFRRRAIQFVHKAAQQSDEDEADRLRSIARYWFRLADAEEWASEPSKRTRH